MGWANQTIDVTITSSGWEGAVATVKWGLLTFDRTGLGFYWNLVALTTFIILLLTYWDISRHTPAHDVYIPTAGDTLPTAEQFLKFFHHIQKHSGAIRIKLLATKEREPLARILLEAFQIAGYDILINDTETDYLFSVFPSHNTIVIRYREKSGLEHVPHYIACTAISLAFRFLGFIPTSRPFPQTSTIEYLQIELGGEQ